MMVSDWLWVSRERALGSPMQFAPYSASVGAIMVPADSPVRTLADLKGRSLSVAGGALDKSWLVVLAAARREGVDLKKEATISYGAPPLLFEKLLQKEHDASLTYWNFAARLETKGYRRLLSVEDAARAVGAGGGVSMLGYTFDGDWAAKNRDALARFLAASREPSRSSRPPTPSGTASAPSPSPPTTPASPPTAPGYREGIPTRPIAEEEADARTLYDVLAELGGPELVGPGKELDPGTYYKP